MPKTKLPIELRIRHESTSNEIGADTNISGDEMIEYHFNGSRLELAAELRQLARMINHTVGDPIESAHIVVLMRRPTHSNS